MNESKIENKLKQMELIFKTIWNFIVLQLSNLQTKLNLPKNSYLYQEWMSYTKQCKDYIYSNEKFLYQNVYNGQQMTPMRRILEAK